MIRPLLCAAVLACLLVPCAQADDPIFSGPQVGENLPSLKMRGIFGVQAQQEFDFLEVARDKPVVIFFVHERTRPAFGLMHAVMEYAGKRNTDGLQSAAVFLTGDATDTEKWMNMVVDYFPKNVEIGISPDGQEGPGAYGLNRNVTLTVLVGKDQKVTANFALVQPSVQADGPKILKAIVDVLGSGEVPDIATLAGRYRTETPSPANMSKEDDPNLRPLLREVINKSATPEQVQAAAKKVEEYVAEHQAAAKQLGQITKTVVNSDRFDQYGTEEARTILKSWSEKYGPTEDAPRQPQRGTDKDQSKEGDRKRDE